MAETVSGRWTPLYLGLPVQHHVTLWGAGRPDWREWHDTAAALAAAAPNAGGEWFDGVMKLLRAIAAGPPDSASGNVRAVCEPCNAAGRPWARTFPGGKTPDRYMRLQAEHGGDT